MYSASYMCSCSILLFECNVIWIFAKETFKTNLPSEKWGINKALESSTSDSGNSN